MGLIIIDTSVHDVFFTCPSRCATLLRKSIGLQQAGKKVKSPELVISIGGSKCLREIKDGPAKDIFLKLVGTPIVRIEKKEDVDLLERKIIDSKVNLSSKNDEWILALAQISGCRLLVTNDKGMPADFRNLLTPPGKCISKDFLQTDTKCKAIRKLIGESPCSRN